LYNYLRGKDMAMEKLTEENVFVGAQIVRGKDKFYVYKVNAKSLYIGTETNQEMEKKYENRPVGKNSWIGFYTSKGAKKVSYDGLTISSEESNKKEGFLAIKEARESMKDWLGKKGKKLVRELFEISRPKLSKTGRILQKGRPVFCTPNHYGNNEVVILGIQDDGHILLRLNSAYLFFDLETEVYTRYNKELHKDGKKIVFPKRVAADIAVAV
jgi:hypothetical protein